MNIDIGNVIRLVLEEKQIATIPGIGTFRVVVQPAQYSKDKSTINPPAAAINFSEEFNNDHNVVEFISQHYDISKVNALKYLEAFENKLREGLKKNKSVRVKGLGSFSKTTRGPIQFKAIQSISKSLFYGLKPVKVDPTAGVTEITSSEAQTSVPSETIQASSISSLNQDLKEQVKEAKASIDTSDNIHDHDGGTGYDSPSKWFFLIRPLLVFVGIAILATMFMRGCFDGCGSGPSTVDDPSGIDTLATTTPIDDNSNNDKDDTDQVKGDDKADKNGGDVKNPSRVDTGKIIKKSMEPDGSLVEVLAYEDLDYKPSSCIIVTGSFRNIKNAYRLQAKMEKMGYDTYAATTDGFTRVGFFFECGDEDLKEYITSIRNNISAGSWYLVPRIHVE